MRNRLTIAEARDLGLLGKGARFGNGAGDGALRRQLERVDRRRNKYAVAPKRDRTLDGEVFPSKHQMIVYGELLNLLRAGEIRDLQREQRFDLIVNGIVVSHVRLDFTYVEVATGEIVYCDAKGRQSLKNRLQYKMFEAQYGKPILLR